jgi:hypothetical protein
MITKGYAANRNNTVKVFFDSMSPHPHIWKMKSSLQTSNSGVPDAL